MESFDTSGIEDALRGIFDQLKLMNRLLAMRIIQEHDGMTQTERAWLEIIKDGKTIA